jgi:hypothetical protein
MAFVLGLCLLLAGVAATAQESKKALTNADVVTMIKAELPESVIVLAIQQSPAHFDTSPKALIQLKNQGATPKILEAMLQPAKPPISAESANRVSPPVENTAVKKVTSHDFNFVLVACKRSDSDSVTCALTVTNHASADRTLQLDSRGTRMLDESGAEYLPIAATFGTQQGKSSYWNLSSLLIPQVAITASVKFGPVSPGVKTIKALRVACIEPWATGKFYADFRDVSIITN